MEKIIVQNLKCGGCANTILNKVGNLEYVENIEVHVGSSTVSVNITDTSKLELVKKKLAHLGYPEENNVNNLSKKAKSFVSCAVGKMKL